MQRRTTLRGCTVILALATTLITAAGLANAAGAKRGGTLTIARPDEALTLDPYIPTDAGSIYAIDQVCETLVLADAKGTGLEPGLAESWDMSPDGLKYTLKLRGDVKFSNGNPMTADDVVFSLKKLADPAATYNFAFQPVSSIDKVDDSHVSISLKSAYTPLISVLSLFSASIVSKADYEKDPKAFGTNPICTGPFKVQSFERGDQLVLVPNAYYWQKGDDGKPLPYLDKVVLKYVPESNSRVLGLRGKEYDVALSVPLNQAAQVKAMDGITLEVSPGYRLDYVYLNHAKAPMDDKRIRLALNYAANRAAILKAVFFGYGQEPNSFMPQMNYWTDKVVPFTFDLEKAKALVKEANYDGTPIKLMIDAGNAPSKQIATILQSGWSQAGLNVEIVEYDGGTAWNMVQKGDYQAYVSYIVSDINDDDELATLETDYYGATKSFFTNYKNDGVIKLVAEARQTSDSAKRAELYANIQETVYHDAYGVPLNFLPYVNAYQNSVKNWLNIAVGWWWLKQVWLDQ